MGKNIDNIFHVEISCDTIKKVAKVLVSKQRDVCNSCS